MWDRWKELNRLAGEVSIWFFSSQYAIPSAIILGILIVIFYFAASTGILNRYFNSLFGKDAFQSKWREMRIWTILLFVGICGLTIIWYWMLISPEFNPQRFQRFSFEQREAALFSIRLLSIAATYSIFFFLFCIGRNYRDLRRASSNDPQSSVGDMEVEKDLEQPTSVQQEPTNEEPSSRAKKE